MDLTKYQNCKALSQWLFVSNNPKPYRPCCWSTYSFDTDSYDAYLENLKNIDIAENCAYCIKMEETGNEWSPRIDFENNLEDDMLVITASFDNFCNLKCVTCSPENSNGIASELDDSDIHDGRTKHDLLKLRRETPKKIDFVKQTIINSKFKHLRFELLGGEPLINPEVTEFLKWLMDQNIASKTILVITTNGTVYNDIIKTYADKFQSVGLQFSIDGVSDTFEYLRTNADSKQVSENINKFYLISEEMEDLSISFNFTLSWMNALNFKDFYNWLVKCFPNTSKLLVTRLQDPEHFSVDILGQHIRDKILENTINQLLPSDNINLVQGKNIYLQHLSSGTQTFNMQLFDRGFTILSEKDRKRKTSFVQSLNDILVFILENCNEMSTEETAKFENKIIVEKATASKTFCILPWVHQYVDPGGEVRPCCAFDTDYKIGTMKENTLKEIWNSEETKSIRKKMLNGELIPGCSKCDNRDDLNINVFRNVVNKKFFHRHQHTVSSTTVDGYVENHNLVYIDARFNNLCNFKCRTCGTRFSTSWFKESVIDRKNKNIPIDPNEKGLVFPGKTNNQLIDEIFPHINNLEEIYFAGGEPLMQIEHYKVLDELIRLDHTGTEQKPLHIYYNTNFSSLTMGKYNVLDYWSKFSNISINASIDGSYERAEYWRKGTDWNKIVENRILLKESCPNVNFHINYTLSWVNAYNLIDFHREWVEKNYLHCNAIILNLLDTPVEYNLKYLPKFKKDKLRQLFLEQIEWMKSLNTNVTNGVQLYKDAIMFMDSVETDDTYIYAKQFKNLIKNYDDLRNENFWEVFPEHQDMKEYLGV